MKKLKGIIVGIVISFFAGQNIFASGYPVFDVESWLAAINEYYQTYDMVCNQITQIEQAYESFQQALEEAQSFNWKEIESDGNFLDIRDEIGSAVGQMNSMLNNVRKFRDVFCNKLVTVNGVSYSITDLCSRGNYKEGTGIQGFVHSVKTEVERTARKMGNALKYGISDKEARYIWTKYGLSPQNYQMVRDTKAYASKLVSGLLGESEQEWEEVRKENEKRMRAVEQLVTLIDKDGNLTQKEIGQVQTKLMGLTAKRIDELRHAMIKLTSYQAWKDAIDDQKEEAEQESNMEVQDEANRHNVQPIF